MLETLFKLVKQCVQRNIPPSTLVKECNLNIDEAALHKSAFELAGRMQEMDFSIITNEKISADGEMVEIPQLKENKQKVKAITHVIEESKNHIKDNSNNNNNKSMEKERIASGKGKKLNNDKKHVNIDKPNKVPELSVDNSRITIEPGMNDGKSFHTEIETDRDNDNEYDNNHNHNAQQIQSNPIVNKDVSINLPKKEEGEPAFKLEMSDLKAMNNKGSIQQLHKEEEVYKPEVNRVPSRQGKKAVRREDP